MQSADLFDGDEGKGLRLRCVGGPLDGRTIATCLYYRTGRGKATVHISLPIHLIPSFDVLVDGVAGQYVYNDDVRQYWYVPGTMGAPPAGAD